MFCHSTPRFLRQKASAREKRTAELRLHANMNETAQQTRQQVACGWCKAHLDGGHSDALLDIDAQHPGDEVLALVRQLDMLREGVLA